MRWRRAPAKINLTLRVVGRRADGLHEIESLVAFTGISDWLGYEPGHRLQLEVEGPSAREAGPAEDNLVLRAARELAARVPGLALGRFRLIKRLPASAGIGGGSADAAAALRARRNERFACRGRTPSRGGRRRRGGRSSAPILESPNDVGRRRSAGRSSRFAGSFRAPRKSSGRSADTTSFRGPWTRSWVGLQPSWQPILAPRSDARVTLDLLVSGCNDLEPAALRIAPAIGATLEKLSRLPAVKAARMSGSGATCSLCSTTDPTRRQSQNDRRRSTGMVGQNDRSPLNAFPESVARLEAVGASRARQAASGSRPELASQRHWPYERFPVIVARNSDNERWKPR